MKDHHGAWPKRLLVVGIVSVLAWLIFAGCQAPEGVPDLLAPKASVGADRSPELEATNLPGLDDPVKPMDEYKGHNGLLAVFVDTSCPFAERAVWGIDAASAALAPHGVYVVLINVDDPKDSVEKYYRNHAVQVPVLYDTTTATKKRWKITRVPTVMLWDAAGREAYVGYGQWPKAARAAETMLHLQPNTINIAAESTGFT